MSATPNMISVVIPAYNSVATLERAVASCLGQGEAFGELIIVDNNSTDGTGRVAKELQKHHPHLIRVATETKQGSAAARNHGIRTSKNAWIQFLDADDELLPGKLKRQYQIIEEGIGWVMGTGLLRRTDGQEVPLLLNPDPWKGVVWGGGLGDMNSSLFHRRALLDVGLFDERLHNGIDMDLYVRFLKRGVRYLQDHAPGAVYHDHDGLRLSREQPKRLIAEEVGRKLDVFNYLKNNRPTYFAQNHRYFRTAILRGIRQQYTVDPLSARAAYAEFFPDGIAANQLDASILPSYYPLYGVLPFHTVESARVTVGKWLRKLRK